MTKLIPLGFLFLFMRSLHDVHEMNEYRAPHVCLSIRMILGPFSLVEVYRRFVAMMMEAVSTSETSVNCYQTTRRNIPEDSHLHTRRRENLKSHLIFLLPVYSYSFC
jgi:hypothetical protein